MKVNYKSQNTKQHYTYLVFSENSDNTIFDLYEKTAFRSLKKVIEHFKQFDNRARMIELNETTFAITSNGERFIVFKVNHGVPYERV